MKTMNWSVLKQLVVDDDQGNLAALPLQDALDQTCPESLDTILHLAARYGQAQLAADILRLCPSMAAKVNRGGQTPLHDACRQGHDGILLMLLEADPWAASVLDREGRTPLYLACCYGHLRAATVLLNQPWLQEPEEGEDASFLHVAISQGHFAIVEKIIKTHPRLAKKADSNGYHLLHHACGRGQPEMVAMLLVHYRRQAFQFNRDGNAPVHLAAINGNTEVLEQLLKFAPTCFELLTGNQETVFHLAVKFIRPDAFRYLALVLDKTGLIHRPDKNGNTCLHLAISRGQYEIADYIINQGGEQINPRNLMGETPMDLLEAAENTSGTQHLKQLMEAAIRERNHESPSALSDSDPPLPEEICLQNNDTHSQILRLSRRKSSSSSNRKGQPIPVFEKEETRTRSRKLRRRMREYEYRAEKNREKLLLTYQMRQHRHEIYREALHNARGTITLVAILIATITYTGGIAPPGGVYQDGPLVGTAVAGRRTAFKVFSTCNNVALFTSLCIVIVHVSIIPFRRKPLMLMLMVAHKAMWVAVGFMAAAYFAASLVLMPASRGWGMDWTVVSLLCFLAGTLGSVFLGLGFLLMRHRVRKMRHKKRVADTPGQRDDGAGVDGFWDGESSNSDLDTEVLLGYHAY